MSRPGRVLSIQSHVVHGHVGNKSAVFPMQLLGLDVDPVNSVQFSNHTGYSAGFTGDRLSGEQLATLVAGLEKNALLAGFTHLLTGYIGDVSFLRHLLAVVAKLRQVNPDLVYVCDPVMGDDGKLYVPDELVAIYREDVVGLATILTPNQFECELLSGCKITDLASAAVACDALHAKGPKVVFLTSSSLGDGDSLTVMISATGGEGSGGPATRHQILIPKLEGYFTGTGDLIAATFLAWHHREPEEPPHCAAEKAVATVQAVLARTLERARAGEGAGEGGREGGGGAPPELALIACKAEIECPTVSCRATPLEI